MNKSNCKAEVEKVRLLKSALADLATKSDSVAQLKELLDFAKQVQEKVKSLDAESLAREKSAIDADIRRLAELVRRKLGNAK